MSRDAKPNCAAFYPNAETVHMVLSVCNLNRHVSHHLTRKNTREDRPCKKKKARSEPGRIRFVKVNSLDIPLVSTIPRLVGLNLSKEKCTHPVVHYSDHSIATHPADCRTCLKKRQITARRYFRRQGPHRKCQHSRLCAVASPLY